ncbi:hypothetical protein RIF29_14803 [Crotalaria pallida]|uniref:CCHC-type domain-containing protein n=1 Tax=Crotalaria pallida TaxID=3830 RepID=A0AAN9FDY3_CROPI
MNERFASLASQGSDSNDANPEFLRGLRLGLKLAFPHLEFSRFGAETGQSDSLMGDFPIGDGKENSVNYSAERGFARSFLHNKGVSRRNQMYHGPYQQNNKNQKNQAGGVWTRNGFGYNRRQHCNNNNNGGNWKTKDSNNLNNGSAHGNGNGEKGQGGVVPLYNRCNRNHYGPNCPYENPNCFNCNKPGHTAKNCWELKREKGSHRPKGSGRVFALVGNEDANASSRS